MSSEEKIFILDQECLFFGSSISFLGQKTKALAGEIFQRPDVAGQGKEREADTIFFQVQPEAWGVFCYPDFDRGG